ncbi:MAG: hypothetical protein AAGG01_21535, partial [Planctomycetota bacterium]
LNAYPMHSSILLIALLAGRVHALRSLEPSVAHPASSGPVIEVVGLQSVESLTFHSDLVAMARPIEARVLESAGQKGARRVTSVRFELREVIRGPLSEGDQVSVWSEGAPWGGFGVQVDSTREVLLFACVPPRADLASPRSALAGRYTLTEFGPGESLFWSDRKIESLYSPSFQPVETAAEAAGAARRWMAYDWRLRAIDRAGAWIDAQLNVPLGSKAFSENFGGSSVVLSVPVFQGQGEQRGPVENRLLEAQAPAVFSVIDSERPLSVLQPNERAFVNRSYVWRDLPGSLAGWYFWVTRGGAPSPISVAVEEDGVVFVAVESKSAAELETHGWTQAPLPVGERFRYSDRGRTSMSVLSRCAVAGETLTIPQIGWTGTLLLQPPRYQLPLSYR